MMDIQKHESFQTILTLIQDSINSVFVIVNGTLVELYWRVGEYVSKQFYETYTDNQKLASLWRENNTIIRWLINDVVTGKIKVA